jgi:hypothetical protein
MPARMAAMAASIRWWSKVVMVKRSSHFNRLRQTFQGERLTKPDSTLGSKGTESPSCVASSSIRTLTVGPGLARDCPVFHLIC